MMLLLTTFYYYVCLYSIYNVYFTFYLHYPFSCCNSAATNKGFQIFGWLHIVAKITTGRLWDAAIQSLKSKFQSTDSHRIELCSVVRLKIPVIWSLIIIWIVLLKNNGNHYVTQDKDAVTVIQQLLR